MLAKTGTPDIVVDDGSHQNAHVIATFRFLFPLLSENGYYVIEDTQTSYWPDGDVTDRNNPKTSMGFFKSLVDGLNWEEFYGDYEPTPFDLQIKSIAFYHNLIVVQKGDNREGSNNRAWHSGTGLWRELTDRRRT